MHLRFTIIAILAAASLGAPAEAGFVEIGAAADATLYEDPLGATANGAGERIITGVSGQPVNPLRRGLLRFDVAAAVPAGATITAVTLTMHVVQTNADPQDVALHRALTAWTEGASDPPGGEGGGTAAGPGDATWLHASAPDDFWTTPGGDFAGAASATSFFGGLGSAAWTGPGLVADVQSWLDAPAGAHGWFILAGEDMPGTSVAFASRQHPDEALRPSLLVEFTVVPAPPAAAVLVVGLLGRRRRRPAQDRRRSAV